MPLFFLLSFQKLIIYSFFLVYIELSFILFLQYRWKNTDIKKDIYLGKIDLKSKINKKDQREGPYK